jgi:hypothetical protein
MTTEPPDTREPAQADDFPLWPYLDTLYRWAESQPWCAPEQADAWRAFVRGVPGAPAEVPSAQDPDQHDRVLRFRAWFHLDRPVGSDAAGRRPIDLFLEAHRDDLTAEGREAYDALSRSIFGAFKVVHQFRLVMLEDLASGQRHRLNPGPLADELVPGDLAAGRLYPAGEGVDGDPDLHIGHMMELGGENARVDAPAAEGRFFAAMVPSKGAVMDVLDALLLQVDSPLTADDVFEMIREAKALDEVVDELFTSPAYRLRYLHLRDRSLLDELLQELWDTSGPMQDANLAPEDATALARMVREALRAIADGQVEALLAVSDPKGFIPLYLELYGLKGLKRLCDVASGAPDTAIRTRHQLLPKDGGIFTTLSWGKDGDKHVASMVSYGTPDGRWVLSDVSQPEGASPALAIAFEKAQGLGWASEAADPVEALLRRAVEDVGYSVHDAIDLFRIWRDFKAQADPDLAQPAIWAAGVELADTRYRNEDLDPKVLAKSYGVMPRAIEAAADEIEAALKARDEAEDAEA